MKKSYWIAIAVVALIGMLIGRYIDNSYTGVGLMCGAVAGFVLVVLHDCNWNPLAVFDYESHTNE